MTRSRHSGYRKLVAKLLLVTAPLTSGCQPTQPFFVNDRGDLSHYLESSTQISYPDVNSQPLPDAEQAIEPLSLENPEFREFWDITLEEAVATALQNDKTINTLGQIRTNWQVGQSATSPPETQLLSPDFNTSIYDPAIQETSNTGVEAALANFDTQLSTGIFWERTDRPQNVEPTTVGQTIFARILESETGNFQTELSKRAATGTQFFARNITNYEGTNRPLRAVPSDWTTLMELEARHPLLKNSGTQFNRIPVVIARIQTDLAIAQLERAVRNQVLEVERSYWDLYFHYFNLQTAKVGSQSALESWRQVKTLAQGGVERGEAFAVALAEEQYYAFEGQVEEAQRRLFQSERNLRALMGLAATDGRFMRPTDKPVLAKVNFDWPSVLDEAMLRSVEIREQGFRIKQRELQVLQARNQVLPQLDLQALYRWVGLGDDLIQASRNGLDFPQPGSTAFETLTGGDFQEWRLGFQFQVPLGVRAEMAQVRNTQLLLARERSRMDTLRLEISHGLSSIYDKVKSQHLLMTTRFNQRRSAVEQVKAFMTLNEVGVQDERNSSSSLPLNQLLDAQRRQAQAEVQYHESVVAYNQALAELHWRKGSLLEVNNVLLQEGPWPRKAYYDSLLRARQNGASRQLNYGFNRPAVVTRGPFMQQGSSQLGTSAESPKGPTGEPTPAQLPLDSGMFSDEPSLGSQPESLPPAAPDPDGSEPLGGGKSNKPSPLPVRPTGATSDDFDWGSLDL